MTSKQFEVGLRHRSSIAILGPYGEINVLADGARKAAYADTTGVYTDAVLLNFRDIGYINSTGIAFVVGLLANALKSGSRLLAFRLNEHYIEIFWITRLYEFIRIFVDGNSAVEGVLKGT